MLTCALEAGLGRMVGGSGMGGGHGGIDYDYRRI